MIQHADNHSTASSYIEAVSVVAPGLPDWQTARTVLRDEQPYAASELTAYQPALLPPNERRRASPTVRMAFRIAEAVTQASSIAANQLASVFSSADGDLNIAQRICTALAQTVRLVSPTDFHNSVHNAAAGYWSIASLAKGPSTAIAAYDYGFAMGLLEAHGMAQIEQQPTLLVVYDIPASPPLHHKRPIQFAAGVGMVLTPAITSNSLASINLQLHQSSEAQCSDATLEQLRLGNPALRALPLLRCIANLQSGIINLALNNIHCVQVSIEPCAA